MMTRWVAATLLATTVAILAGCGGGGGGGGGGSSTPVSEATIGPTITGITINSPPVVTFVVKDSAGHSVSGLKLYDPNSSTACGSSNVSFAIAKFDGSNWQSLISRQRYAVDDLSDPAAPKHAVIEGTTDPKPTATITNPPTAVSDPSTRVVGILEEASGVYTYRFATDVTTPLLLANAVEGRNVTPGKVANNGNLAVKDGKTLHRVVLQLCYIDPVTQATVKLNPYMDFTLGANGKGVPFKDSQGNLTAARKVVDSASCSECHQTFALHNQDLGNDPSRPDYGIYVDPQACVMCHNPGSADFNTGNPIDFKLMVHKLHMGKRLTQDYVVGAAVARQDLGGGVIAGVLYPQDQRNCVKCHDGSATAVHRTPQGDNWINKPSKNACLACHDDYKVPGSKWQKFHAGFASFFSPPGPSNPDNTPDFVCQQCHNSAGVSPAQSHEIPEFVKSENYQYNIWGITKNADNTLTVEYSVSNPKTGTDYDILNPAYQYTVTDGTTTTKTFSFGALNLLFGWNSTDYTNDGALGRPWNSDCTLAPTSTCSAAGLPTAGTAGPITRGQPVSINIVFDSSVQRVGNSNHFTLTSTILPAAASGTIAVAFQGAVREQKDASSSWVIPVKNVVKYFAMSGAEKDRRQVVSADKCNACHGRNLAFTDLDTFVPGLGGHDGSQTDPEVCVICHNGNNPLNGTVVSGGVVTQYAETADFKRMIHMMHLQQAGNYPVWPNVETTTHLNSNIWSGLKECEVCHVNGSYKQNLSTVGTSVTFDVDTSTDSTNATVTDTDASNNLVISPKASTCSSCHSSADAKAHMISQGGAAFGTVTQGQLAAGQVFESCDGCHQPGGIEPVDTVHLGLTK